MTPAQVLDQVRYLCKVSSTDGSGSEADLVRVLNDYYLRQVSIFVNLNEDLFGRKATTNLNVVSNQEAYGLPSDAMRIKRVEVSYDGSNWYKVSMMDDNEVQDYALDTTNVRNLYTSSNPYADLFGNHLYLRPIPTQAVSSGLRLYYIAQPTLITNISVDTFQTPSEYHGYLAYGVAGEVATRQGNDALGGAMFQKWEDGRVKAEKQYAPRDLDYRVSMGLLPDTYT